MEAKNLKFCFREKWGERLDYQCSNSCKHQWLPKALCIKCVTLEDHVTVLLTLLSGHQTGGSNRSIVVMILRVVVCLLDYIVLIGWIHSTLSMSHTFSDNRLNNVYFLMLRVCRSKYLCWNKFIQTGRRKA